METHTETFSGAELSFEDPQPKDIKLIDIAWHLGGMCRFNAGTNTFYSVAQHSVLASRFGEPKDSLALLMHDAHEAYTGDIISPLKSLCPKFRTIQLLIQDAIHERFGLPIHLPIGTEEMIDKIDLQLLATELIQLTRYHDKPWASLKDVTPLNIKITPWDAHDSRVHFLKRFNELTGLVYATEVREAFEELDKVK